MRGDCKLITEAIMFSSPFLVDLNSAQFLFGFTSNIAKLL